MGGPEDITGNYGEGEIMSEKICVTYSVYYPLEPIPLGIDIRVNHYNRVVNISPDRTVETYRYEHTPEYHRWLADKMEELMLRSKSEDWSL